MRITTISIYLFSISILVFTCIFVSSGCLSKESLSSIDSLNVDTNIDLTYMIVDTGQTSYYDESEEISYPEQDETFYGQDAQYNGYQPSYHDNKDGTISDLTTGLMWQQDPGEKMTYDQAVILADSFALAGYNDWRLPTIKDLYSLIDFSGTDPSIGTTTNLQPFINTEYFDFTYGDENAGERIIDSQFASSTVYTGDSEFGGGNLMFGVNFADGRIKGYPTGPMPGQDEGKQFYVLFVRNNTDYGMNNFIDNGDGTITDLSTGLIWQKTDSGEGMIWKDALTYAETLELAEYTDWRLPNAKELQSIIDYTRSPDSTDSPAIDSIFDTTSISNEEGNKDYPYFWTSTTHISHPNHGESAVYISFGRALGFFNGEWLDVHGAGAQRSDPKNGDPTDYAEGHGPQGDAVRIYNYVRCVRGGLTNNQAPETPMVPDGPDIGKTGNTYTFSTKSIDPDGDQLYYQFDWGDDTTPKWLGPFESNQEINSTHSWNNKGSFMVKVKAKDINGAESEWSESLTISLSKTKTENNLLNLFSRIQKILTNTLINYF